jgi:hypothetical protein
VYADALTFWEVVSDGVVAVGRCAALWEMDMSWWKQALIYVGKKALQIAGEELGKKTRKK